MKTHRHERLPDYCKAILKTPRKFMTVKKCGDDCHFDLLNSVKRILCENQVIISDQKINLVVDVDDVLLCKSISAQFWSIICYFHKLPSFTVGIYYSNKKWSNVKEFALAVKRLILFWKEFLIDYLQYSDHKNFKQVGRNCWTASNRICVEATWIWWGKKVEGYKQ